MAGWGFSSQRMSYRGFEDGNEILMGLVGSQKPGVVVDLLQNCDLPPPLKVFSGYDNKVVSPPSWVSGYNQEDGFRGARSGVEDDKLELLKALRLSQSRAREAERRAATLAKERDVLARALMHDSMSLMAHRQWVRLLEAQVKMLKSQWMRSVCGQSDESGDKGEDSVGVGVSWMVALALCLGIVGVGLTFSCTSMS